MSRLRLRAKHLDRAGFERDFLPSVVVVRDLTFDHVVQHLFLLMAVPLSVISSTARGRVGESQEGKPGSLERGREQDATRDVSELDPAGDNAYIPGRFSKIHHGLD
jgi:hypothetical protein